MSQPRTGLSPWFVTGLADGLGVFTYSRTEAQLTIVFALRLPAADGPLLAAVREHLGNVGKIYTGARSAPGGEIDRPAPSHCLRVTRPPDLLRVVAHFDRFPLQSGNRGLYRLWREMVLLRAAHHGRRAPAALCELAEGLSARRRETAISNAGRIGV